MAKKATKKYAGNYKEKSIVAHRFMEAYAKLKQKRVIKNYKDIAEKFGYDADVISNIASGKQEVPLVLIWGMVVEYGVDANFLFDVEKELLREK